jgi:NADP-dependent 3-hydroxy acid dehydrogenase YdfG
MSQKPLVVITGASSGIGRATAIAFSRNGHPLLLLARRLDRLQELNLPNCLCLPVDVRELGPMKEAIKQAEAQFGPVDCLINNAGIMLLGAMHEQAPSEWKDMYDVNVLGLMNGIHAVLDAMIKRQTGTIINISSIAGKKTFPNHAAYVGTKFAVHSVTENIREEVAKHNVRMMTIAPGVVETELLGHTTSETIKDGYGQWKETIGGGLAPETVADTIYFAYSQPQHVNIREIALAPTKQEG